MKIDKNSFTPLYHQLASQFKQLVTQGKLLPGDSMPSESVLMEKYQISRGTVRQAMQLLENEGLIEKFPGRGTFISKPKEESKPSTKPETKKDIAVTSMFEQIKESTSKNSGIFLIEKHQQIATPQIQNLLKLPDDSVVLYLSRILSVEKEPWCAEKSYYPDDMAGIMEKFDLNQPLYQQFQKKTGHKIIVTKYIIESIPADENFSALLSTKIGDPLFQLIRISYFDNNQPFELSFDTYRADRVRFNLAMAYDSEDMKFNIKPLKPFR